MKTTFKVISPKSLNSGNARVAHGVRQSVQVVFHAKERHPTAVRVRLEGNVAFTDPVPLAVVAATRGWPSLRCGTAVPHPDGRGYDVHICTPIQADPNTGLHTVYLNGTKDVRFTAARTPAQDPGELSSLFPGEVINTQQYLRVVCEAPRPYRPARSITSEPLEDWTGELPDIALTLGRPTPTEPAPAVDVELDVPVMDASTTEPAPAVDVELDVPVMDASTTEPAPAVDVELDVPGTVEAAQAILRSEPSWLTSDSQAFIERLNIPVIR